MVKFLFSVHTITEAKQINRQGGAKGGSQGGGSSSQVIWPVWKIHRPGVALRRHCTGW